MVRCGSALTHALLVSLALAGCGQQPELAILARAGVSPTFSCAVAQGLRQTTLCGGILPTAGARAAITALGLRPLATPVRLGATSNILALPPECQVLLFNGAPQVIDFLEVFDSPAALYDAGSRVQFASMVLARNPATRQTCFILVRP